MRIEECEYAVHFSNCRVSWENHVKTNTKTILKVTNLAKNDEQFYSKNAQLKILNLG